MNQPGSDLGFITCEACNGAGFVRQGSIAMGESFHRCTKCEGIGQAYICPKPPPPEEKKA